MTMEAQAKSTNSVSNGKISVQILSPHVEKIPPPPTPTKPSPSDNLTISSRIKRLTQRKKVPDAPTSDIGSQKQKRPQKFMIIGSEAANGIKRPATEYPKASFSTSEDNIKPVAEQSKASSSNTMDHIAESALTSALTSASTSASTSSASTPAWSFVSTSGSGSSPPPKVASSRIGSLFERMMPHKRASVVAKPKESPIEYMLFDEEGRPAWTMRRTTKETEADLLEELEDVDCVQLE